MTAPHRILVTALHFFPEQPTGSGRLAYDEACFLTEQGHETWLLTPAMGGSGHTCSRRDGVHVVRYTWPAIGAWSPGVMEGHRRAVAAALAPYAPESFDVVHGHTPVQYLAALAACPLATRRAFSVHSPVRLELLATARGERLARRVRATIAARVAHRWERQCLERSTLVTADSAYTKSLMRGLHGTRHGDRIEVIPGWVEPSRFPVVPDRAALKARLGWPAGTPTLFTLRRLVPRMGLNGLLEATRAVKAKGLDFRLVVAGDGPLAGALARRAGELGLSETVRFVGRVSNEQVADLYAAADAFVLPTAELECFGLIALEAMSCGRPVLATPVGAIPEVVGRFEPAWLAKDAGPPAIADLITAWLCGELPSHDPAELHAEVARQYAISVVLPRLINAVLESS